MNQDKQESAWATDAGSMDLAAARRRAALAAAVTIALGAGGCHKPPAPPGADAAPGPQAAAEIGGEDAGLSAEEVPPVPPLVPADPSIPLNEAVVGAAPIRADYAAPVAPPSAPVEQQPPQPEADESWVPGYWWWSAPLDRYVWVGGAWRRPPPDQVWTPGSWSPVDGRYVWSPGYWGPHGYARVTVDLAPPPLQVELRGSAPGVGFVWTPGYFAFRAGAYAWVAGAWLRPPSVGLGWVEPRYVGIGGRFYLQPGRWDFPPERRGIVYGPDIRVRGGERVRLAPVPGAVVSAHARFDAHAAHAAALGEHMRPHELRPGGEAHGGFEHREQGPGPRPEHREGPETRPEHRESAPRVERGPEHTRGPAPAQHAAEHRRH